MVDNSNPTNQFHPYTGTDVTPQSEVTRSGLSGILAKLGIDRNMIGSVRNSMRNVDTRQTVDKVRGAAQKNPAAVLGGLAALVIGAGLMRSRRS